MEGSVEVGADGVLASVKGIETQEKTLHSNIDTDIDYWRRGILWRSDRVILWKNGPRVWLSLKPR